MSYRNQTFLLIFLFAFSTELAAQRKVIGKITGTVKYHRDIKAEGLTARDVIVWLPPGYRSTASARYPVIYMHDGQNIIDPVTSAFGVDWGVDEVADSLIRHDLVRPFIIVGIYNTPERTDEYMPGKLSDAYLKLIINTIKPLIDKTYLTLPDKKNTFTAGASAGGQIAFKMVYEHADIFSRAICMSPAFKINQWDYVQNVARGEAKKSEVFFYLDNGGLGIDGQLQPGIDEMIKILQQKGYKEWKDFAFFHEPQSRHSEQDWGIRFINAIQLILSEM